MTTENTKVVQSTNNKPDFISKQKIIDSGIQFGHITRRWNPAMKPFIRQANKGVHIIDLNKTVSALQIAFKAVQQISEKGGKFLFVGTSNPAKLTVKENALRTDSYYVDERWLGGLLTNWKTINNSINRMKTLENMEKQNFLGYNKKESILMKKELIKLEKTLGGIRNLRRLPSAIFVASVDVEHIAIKEAKKLGIPVFGIVDTNVDPTKIEFPIPGNDDANRSIALVTTVIADAIAFAQQKPMSLAHQPEEEGTIIGIDERYQNLRKDAPIRKPGKGGKLGMKPKFQKPTRAPKTYEKRENNITKEVKEELVTKVDEAVVIEDKNIE